ncbi:hypothetical protein J2S72_000786 [Peptoniphilus koenoeneniae]|uniref:Uncharacterized protein n=1 Tax=Peptoniphilus koenoeneniae TaxID=507751 RepID=A0ABU0AU57_9FIRM|nr:cobalt ABC transporter [Peptoniphilus koenoeneniae]MDQ0274769.1 hypothetical protein [Peptoniphilus koenoeneniae]
MADELNGLARLIQEFIEKYADPIDFNSLEAPPENLDMENKENNKEGTKPTN